MLQRSIFAAALAAGLFCASLAEAAPSLVITPVGQAQDDRTPAELHQEAIDQCRAGGNPTIDGVCRRSEAAFNYQDSQFALALRATGYLSVDVPRTAIVSEGFTTSPCTAWLVARNLIVTAAHCVTAADSEVYPPGQPPSVGLIPGRMRARVTFGRQISASGAITASGQDFTVTHIVEVNPDLDYAVLAVAPAGGSHAGDLFGVIRFLGSPTPTWTEPGARLYIAHFPAAGQQQITKDNTCAVMSGFDGSPSRLAHHCDTTGGSSGSPILTYATANQIGSTAISGLPIAVALHTDGPEESITTELRLGTRMAAIVAQSELLSSLACTRTGGRVDCPAPALMQENGETIAASYRLVTVDAYPTNSPFPDQSWLIANAGQPSRLVQELMQGVNASPTPTRIRVIGYAHAQETNAEALAFARGANVAFGLNTYPVVEVSGVVIRTGPNTAAARQVVVVYEW